MTLHDYSLHCATKRYMYKGAPCTGPGPAKCPRCAAGHYGPAKGPPVALATWVMSRIERALVDLFLPVSQATARGSGLPGSGLPYHVIPNFVPDDVGRLPAAPDPRLAALPAEPFLLFVGDLTPAKGLDVLLRAYAGLAAPPPLVLIGRRSAATPRALPAGVTLLESWPHAAVMGAWHRSLLGLVPSVWPDPCPTVAMEAMATGRPVVAARSGGLIDIVADGETGLLVPPGDAAALRAALAELLAAPARRQAMGEAARRRVVQFQAGTVVPRIEQAYLTVRARGVEERRWPIVSR
jgi:glycosyltransferase involved in cell wall biosynthesis